MSFPRIASFQLESFRNLQPASLDFSPQLNLVTGENAAGKTSLLEALYVLARAHSFRSTSLDKLVGHGASRFQLLAQVQLTGSRTVPVGMKREKHKLHARVQSKAVRRVSDIASLLPLHWLGSNPQCLFESGPDQRRRFLDWGLFHVKPRYSENWKSYQEALKQRNAALRNARSKDEIVIWDRSLLDSAAELDSLRKEYVAAIGGVLGQAVEEFGTWLDGITIEYQQGWRAGGSLREHLKQRLQTDRDRGFTGGGPHRADMVLRYDDVPARDCLSRGQLKILAICLHMARAELLKQASGHSSLFLLDDLGAELDRENQQRILARLRTLDAQIFVSALTDSVVDIPTSFSSKKFHVKHGVIVEK